MRRDVEDVDLARLGERRDVVGVGREGRAGRQRVAERSCPDAVDAALVRDRAVREDRVVVRVVVVRVLVVVVCERE